MKILYFITGLGVGGAEAVTINLANFMISRGHRVTIVYLSGENEWTSQISPEIDLVGLKMTKTFGGLIVAYRKSVKIILGIKPDVIHSHMVHSNIFVRVLRLFVKMPYLICTEHTQNIGGKTRMLAYRMTNGLSDLNTCVSQDAVDFLVNRKVFSKRNSICVYNGIDMDRFRFNPATRKSIRKKYQIAEEEFLFLNVGRLVSAKDQRNLIRAFSLLTKGKLIIVGKGGLYDDLQNLISELNLNERVILAGAHSDVEVFYSSADCFVLSSAWEGFGLVLGEAMAAGLPVISTDAGGCVEVVGDTSFVVPIGDTIKLAEKMKMLASMSSHELSDIGERNRSYVMRFNINSICKVWSNLYSEGL